MYSEKLFNHYRVGRFVFVVALLVSFQIAGFPFANRALMSVLAIYGVVSFVRFIVHSTRISPLDFLLDVMFISAMVYLGRGASPFLTPLYLFPIFFASVLLRTRATYLLPVLCMGLYGAAYWGAGSVIRSEHIASFALYLLSFGLVSFVGQNLKERMEEQDEYIKSLEAEKIKMQGFERLYRVSADLAHELRNPLASISGAVQFLREGRRDADLIDLLSEETGRLTNLVNDFLFFARPSDAPREEVDVSDMLKTLVVHQKSDRHLTAEIPEGITVVANRSLAEVAMTNIIKNATEAARSRISIALKKMKREIIIEVEDDGSGVPKEAEDKIFEPFFTTKAHGTGLGLAIAYRIITSFGGNIVLGRSPLGGAKFTIVLPARVTSY
jgi:signal transduction histidine kinase